MCDCWIGILNDYDQSDTNNLYLSDVENKLRERSRFSTGLAKDFTLFNVYKPKDYIDRRRGLTTLFNFCPLCGSKINWKEIHALVKEV